MHVDDVGLIFLQAVHGARNIALRTISVVFQDTVESVLRPFLEALTRALPAFCDRGNPLDILRVKKYQKSFDLDEATQSEIRTLVGHFSID